MSAAFFADRKMGGKRWGLLFCLLFAERLFGGAAGGDVLVRGWTTDDGLPQSRVVALAQSAEGYLWVGTLNGLARFDGMRFVVFDAVNTPAFRTSEMLSLVGTRGHGLLVQTRDGLWFRGEGGVFRELPALRGNGWVAEDAAGTLWLVAAGKLHTLRAEGTPISNLTPASPGGQRAVLDTLARWNGRFAAERADDSRLTAQLANYELAYRMQTAAPDLINLADESAATRELYGVDRVPTAKFGRMCLLARRMAERGVRFIHLFNNDWDGHADNAGNHRANAAATDQPIAALLADLKQRGLLESTLVVWAGEFGRTPVMQGGGGRDHNPYGFSVWLAGGGVRGGQAIGATDEFGFRAVEKKVHVHDLHATLLAALGLDHERLAYHFEGRARRLTDVFGHVVKEVLA